MIKKWNQYINESNDMPGPDSPGSKSISLSSDEMEYFTEPSLSDLISTERVALYDNELWYWEDDEQTLNTLKQYFSEIDDLDASHYDMDEEEFESKINEKKNTKEIRVEKNGKGYSFIEIVDGDSKNGKDITLSAKQRRDIEKILNK